VRGLVGGYAGTRVLDGVELDVPEGSAMSLLGRNGVGKTTFVLMLMGLVPCRGSIVFDGNELVGRASHEISRLGLGLVPQGRRVFSPLTVQENLRIAVRRRDKSTDWDIERVYDLFPRLAERKKHRGDQLSGGEQEMLAFGRALVTNPRLLLLDEPSDGLAPIIVNTIAEVLEKLAQSGVTILLVEQNLSLALRVAKDVTVMTKGRVTYRGTSADLAADPAQVRALLGMG
jgi:branched-chain amino acid transport system ATP-binding protein